MHKHISYLFLLFFLFYTLSVDARKKNNRDRETNENLIAMIEPDEMARPAIAHHIVAPIEEASRHHITPTNNRYGIDVSRYQGKIDWEKVKTDENAGYVYIKATEGASLIDRTYHYNLREAKKAGLKVGCYHFFSPTVPPEEQFKNFSETVKLEEQDLIPIIDVEIIGRTNVENFRKRLDSFLEMVKKHYGLNPIIYTSSNFYNKYLAGRYTEYKYMIARYKEEVPELTDDIKFVMWQFTASGRIKGINGPVDRSRFMDDYHLGDILIKR